MERRLESKTETGREIVTAEEIARTYGVSRRCITNWVNRRMIPVLRISPRMIRFDTAKVKLALERFEQQEITRH